MRVTYSFKPTYFILASFLIVLVGGDGGAVIIALNVLIEEERCRRIDIEEERCRRNRRRERLIASSFPPKTMRELPDVSCHHLQDDLVQHIANASSKVRR